MNMECTETVRSGKGRDGSFTRETRAPFVLRTELECLPCFLRQIRRSLAYAGVNGDEVRRIRRMAEAVVEEAKLDEVPARTSTRIHRVLNRETGVDPYKQLKDRYNRIALELLPGLRKRVDAAADPFEGAVRTAIAGNVIDFGIYEEIDLDQSIEDAFRLPLPRADYEAFAGAVSASHRILYLCDNAGEIVFDRILVELLRAAGKELTVAVKGSPVINDATREDAEAAGLAASAGILDNGNDGIGTLLEACSPRFLEAYRSADLIVSKGQANFETLAGTGDDRIFFLFKVKCPVVAHAIRRGNGDIVLMRNG